jgi:hypothetical protein
MTVVVTCPHCRQSNQVDDGRVAVEVRCVHCRNVFLIESPRVEGIQAIAKNLESIFHRDVAFKGLVEMGPAAEKAVIPYLTHNDEWVRTKAQELIAGYKKGSGK